MNKKAFLCKVIQKKPTTKGYSEKHSIYKEKGWFADSEKRAP